MRWWDYRANSKFLSTQGHQNLRPGFSEGWFFLVIGETGGSCDTLSPSGEGYLYLPHQASCTVPSCSHVRDTSRDQEWVYGVEHVCECVRCVQAIAAACGDRGSLSRNFPPPWSIISQPTAWGVGGGGVAEFPQAKENHEVTFLVKTDGR